MQQKTSLGPRSVCRPTPGHWRSDHRLSFRIPCLAGLGRQGNADGTSRYLPAYPPLSPSPPPPPPLRCFPGRPRGGVGRSGPAARAGEERQVVVMSHGRCTMPSASHHGFGFVGRAGRRGGFLREDVCEVAGRCRVVRIVQEVGNSCRDLVRRRLCAQAYAGAVP